jgi:hypothetical protein
VTVGRILPGRMQTAMSEGFPRYVLVAHRLVSSPAASARRRLAGCGDAQHVLFVFVSGERGGTQHPRFGSQSSLPYLYQISRRRV